MGCKYEMNFCVAFVNNQNYKRIPIAQRNGTLWFTTFTKLPYKVQTTKG